MRHSFNIWRAFGVTKKYWQCKVGVWSDTCKGREVTQMVLAFPLPFLSFFSSSFSFPPPHSPSPSPPSAPPPRPLSPSLLLAIDYWFFFGKKFDECLREPMRILLHVKRISVNAPVVWASGLFHRLFYLMFPTTLWHGSWFPYVVDEETEAARVLGVASGLQTQACLTNPRALQLPSTLHVLWQEALRANWQQRPGRVQQSSQNGLKSLKQDPSRNLFKRRLYWLLLYQLK